MPTDIKAEMLEIRKIIAAFSFFNSSFVMASEKNVPMYNFILSNHIPFYISAGPFLKRHLLVNRLDSDH